MKKTTIIIGTIGRDCHAIGQWVVAKYLEEKGYKVVKLGICVSQNEFVDAAIETNADAVFVSSLYGMGYNDSQGLREKLIEAGKPDILLYAGGMLEVGGDTPWEEISQRFRDIGFNRAYHRDINLDDVLKDLNDDLARVGSSKKN